MAGGDRRRPGGADAWATGNRERPDRRLGGVPRGGRRESGEDSADAGEAIPVLFRPARSSATSFESVEFIGGGRVARIMLGGLNRATALPAEVVLSEPDRQAKEALRPFVPESTAFGELAEAASKQLVVLAVHPPAMAPVLESIRDMLSPGTTVMSLAPKVSLARLRELLGGHVNVVRVIPNAPSLVGAGFNPVAFSDAMAPTTRDAVLTYLRPLGVCPVVEERKLEAFAVISGMGPTYLWFQLDVLRSLGEGFGLSRDENERAVLAMANGAAATLRHAGLPWGQARDLVPVKPLGDAEPAISEMYRAKLSAVMAKLQVG